MRHHLPGQHYRAGIAQLGVGIADFLADRNGQRLSGDGPLSENAVY